MHHLRLVREGRGLLHRVFFGPMKAGLDKIDADRSSMLHSAGMHGLMLNVEEVRKVMKLLGNTSPRAEEALFPNHMSLNESC